MYINIQHPLRTFTYLNAYNINDVGISYIAQYLQENQAEKICVYIHICTLYIIQVE